MNEEKAVVLIAKEMKSAERILNGEAVLTKLSVQVLSKVYRADKRWHFVNPPFKMLPVFHAKNETSPFKEKNSVVFLGETQQAFLIRAMVSSA